MSYMDRLKAIKSEIGHPPLPPKPPKMPVEASQPIIVGFVGSYPPPISENARADLPRDPRWLALSNLPEPGRRWASLIEHRAAGTDPTSIPAARWQQVLSDAAAFIATWAEQADAMGWTEYDLFAVPPGPERWLRSGLIALLRGRPVIAITADAITIANPRGDPNRYRRSENKGAVMLWDRRAYSENLGDDDGAA